MTRKIKKTKGEEDTTSDSDSETGRSDAAWEEIPLRDLPAKQPQAAGEECESDSTGDAGVEFHSGTVSFVKKKKQEEQKTRQGTEDSFSGHERLESGGVKSKNPGPTFRPDESKKTTETEGALGRGRQQVDRDDTETAEGGFEDKYSSEGAGSSDINVDSRNVETPGGATATPTTASQPPTEPEKKKESEGWNFCPRKRFSRWWRVSQCRKRIGEVPGWFALGTVVWLLTLWVATRVTWDVVDIPVAILVLISVCSAVTLSFKRACNTEDGVGRYEILDLDASGLTSHFYHPPVFDCSLCCCMHVSYQPVDRQPAVHRPPADTNFSHEIADIFEMSRTDFPQMKTVETKDNEISTSPESLPEPFRTVAADVHASGSAAEPGEDYGVRCEHYGQGVACGCAALDLERKQD